MRKSVKLILIALMIIVLASSLFACGKNPDPPYSGIPDVEIDQGGEESGTVEEVVAVSASPKYLQFIFNEKSLANKNTIVFPIGTTNVSEGYKVFNFDTTNPLISIEVYGDIKYSDKTVKENQRLNIKLTENSTDVLEKFPLIEGYLKNDPQYEDKLKSSGKTVLNITIPEIYIEGASGHFTKAINLIGQTQIYLAKQHSADSCSITFDGLDTKYFAKEGASFASKISVVKNERINFSKFNATYPVVENKDRPNDSILSYWEVKDDISGNILYYFGINPNPVKEVAPASIENPEIDPSIEFVTLFTLDKDVTIKPIFTTNIATVTVEGQEYKYPMGEKIPYDIVGEYTPDAGKVLLGWKNKGEVWDFNNPIVEKDNILTPILNDKELSLVIYMRGGLFNFINKDGVKSLPLPKDPSTITKTVRSYVSFQKEAPFGVNILTLDGFTTKTKQINEEENKTPVEIEIDNKYSDYKAVTRTEENGVTYDIYLSEIFETFSKPDYKKVVLSEDKENFSTAWNPTNVIEKDLVLYAKWDLDINSKDSQILYDQRLFKDNFTVKSDGTIRLDKIEDYYIESLKIPNEYTYMSKTYFVSELGDMMCQNFSGLRSLDLSETTKLTKIGFRTFANCVQLNEITLPQNANFDVIGEAAFEGTKFINQFESSVVRLGNIILNSKVVDGKLSIKSTNLFNDGTKLIIAPGAFAERLDIKEIELIGVERIESRAFAGCGLAERIKVPENEYKESVTIDDAIKYIAPDAFETTDFNAKDVIRFGNYLYKVNKIDETTNKYDLTGITIIGENAFVNVPNLTTITGESGITDIYKDAFKDTVFVRTEGYISEKTYVDNGFVVVNNILCNYTGREQVVVLPQKLTQIAPYAFSGYNNRDVIDIILPPSISKIGEYAFKDAFSKYKSGRGDARIYILNNSYVDIHPTAFATDYTIVGEHNVVKEVKGGLPTYLRFVYSSAVILNDGKELKAPYLQKLAEKFYEENKLTDYFKNFKVVQEDKDNRFNTDIVKLDFLQDAKEIDIEDIQNEMLGVDSDNKNEIFNAIFLTYKMVDDPDDIGSIAKTSILINNDFAQFVYDNKNSTITYKLYAPQTLPIGISVVPQLQVEQKLNLRHTFKGINETSGLITINLNAPDAPVKIKSGPFNSGEEVPYIFENALLDNLILSYTWKTPETVKESSLTDLGLKNSQIKFVNRISTPDKETEEAQMVLVYEVINYGKNSEKNLTYKFILDYTIKRVKYTGIALKSANPQNPDIVDESLKIPVNTSIKNLDPNNFVLTKNDGTTTIPNSFNTAGFIILNVQYENPSIKVNFADFILRDLGKGYVDALYIIGNTRLELQFKFKVVMRPNLDMFEYVFHRVGSEYFATITGISKDAKGTIMIPAYVSYNDFAHNSMIQGAMMACKDENHSIGDLKFKVNKIDLSNNTTKNLRITEIGMPNHIEEIGNKSFYEWSELYRIGYYDVNCTELTAEDFSAGQNAKNGFPESLKVIGEEAFSGTKMNEVVVKSNDIIVRKGAFKNTPISRVVINATTTVIEMHAFANCNSLLTVELPTSGVEIQTQAFFECYKLHTVTNVEKANLFKGAFTNCISLEVTSSGEGTNPGYQNCGNNSVFNIEGTTLKGFKPELGTTIEYLSIPSNIETIADNAFEENKNIKYLVINSRSINIGANAFAGCTNLATIIINSIENVTIASTSFSGITPSELTIPISAIEFIPKTNLEKVVFVRGTELSGNNILQGCTTLRSVELPNELLTIGANAFDGCTGLTSMEIPASVTTLGAKAFNGCASLLAVNVPASVTTIGENAFSGCAEITIIKVDPNNQIYKSSNNCILTKDGETLLVGCKNSIIPTSVIRIGANAFSGCKNLLSVEIADSVTTIGANAFNGCTGLITVTILGTPTIGADAFSNCLNIVNLTTNANSIDKFTSGKIENLIITGGAITDNACKDKAALKTVTIKNGVTSIGASAFNGCTGLITVTILGNPTIGVDTFSNCLNIVNLTTNASAIGKFTSDKIENLTITGGAITDNACKDKVALKTVTIKEGVTSIGASAFSGCVNLLTIEIADSVITIAENAFNGCSTLKTIVIPLSVTTIGANAFNGCTGLITVTILGNPTIGLDAFSNCPNIINLTTNANSMDKFTSGKIENLTITGGAITDNACKDKVALKAVAIKNGVTSIGASAFSGCKNLLSIEIANSVETIGANAFDGCIALKTIVIPLSVTTIGANAFNGCTGLITVTILGNPTIGADTFSNCLNIVNLTTNASAIGKFTSGKIENLTITGGEIATNACKDKAALKTVTIKNGVTSIGASAFSGCVNLLTIEIADSVITIAENAFNGCSTLKTIVIPSSVTTIGANAFNGCIALKSIIIPSSVTKVEANAFNGCTALTTIEIIGLGKTIATNAFNGCENVIKLTIPVDMIAKMPKVRVKEVIINNGTTIATNQFAGYDRLGKVVLGDTVTTIEANAFSGCYKLKTIIISSSLTTILANSFNGCIGLQAITIPSSVTKVEANAFNGCSALTTIEIIGSGKNVADNAFNGCTNIIKLIIPVDMIAKMPKATVKEIVINGGTTINANQFAGYDSLEKVVLGETVTTIAENAFNGCSALTTIEIIGSGKHVAANAFNGCTNITKLIIPIDAVAKMPKATIKEIVINGGTTINANQFADYGSLEKVVLGETVTTIVANAFNGCTTLKTIMISSSVTTIEGNAFNGCIEIISIKVDPNNQKYKSSNNCILTKDGKTLLVGCKNSIIPTSVTTIAENAFNGCVGLQTITIPSSVTKVETNAFNGCSALTTIEIIGLGKDVADNAFNGCTSITKLIIPIDVVAKMPKATVKEIVINGGTTIGANAFNGYVALQTITIPLSVTKVETNAFNGCSALTTIEIIGLGKDVADNAFNGCTNITKLIIPIDAVAKMPKATIKEIVINGGTTINANQFADYGSVEKVVLGETVTTIAENAFNGCSTLKTIIIPSSITRIGANAFNGCTGLITVTILGNPTIGLDAFSNCPNIINLTTNANSIDKFTSGKIENLTITGGAITDNACKDKAALKTVTINEGVTSIGASAFSGCVNLLTIEIADSVETIGAKAFEGCTKLNTVIYVINKPANIAEDAFFGLTNYKVLIKLTK